MLLSGAGVTLDEMSERLGVSRKTATRYLRALENAGIPIYEERDGRSKTWHLTPDARQTTVRLTVAQTVSLVLVKEVVGFLQGTGVAEDLHKVFEQLEATLRRRDLVEARHLDRKLFDLNEEAYRYDGRVEDVDQLVTGLLREERVDVRHVAVGKGRTRFVFAPYSLVIYKKGLYVVGRSEHHGATRTFALDGFRAIDWRRGDRFDYPEKYRPADHFAGCFGIAAAGGSPTLVRIRFDASVERAVRRRRWHSTQRIRRREDGAIELTMRVRPNFEVENFVLRFGELAEVLEPAALRESMARRAGLMARVYYREAAAD